MNNDQINTIKRKLNETVQVNLFSTVPEFMAAIKATLADPSFTDDVEPYLNGLYDYAIVDLSKPSYMRFDVAIQLTAGTLFYYFPLVITHESI